MAVTNTAATFLGRYSSPVHVDAKPFQHVGHDLFGEGRVADAVAGAVEADNEAVSTRSLPRTPSTSTRSLMRMGFGHRAGGQGQQAKKAE